MTNLVFEQDAKLNPHVIDMRPITWRQRWDWAYLGQILAVTILWFSTLQFLSLWSEDKLISSMYLLNGLVILPLLCYGVPMVWGEWMARKERTSLRRMELDGKYLLLSAHGIVPWERVDGWHIAPLESEPSFQKITVIYRPDEKSTASKHWSIILVEPAQGNRLRSLLDERTRAGKLGAQLLSELPLVRAQHKPSIIGLILGLTGGTIFVFALMGLFGATMFLKRSNIPIASSLLRPVNGNLENLMASVMERFHSSHELGWCMVAVGLIGLLTGFLMFRFGNRMLSRHRPG